MGENVLGIGSEHGQSDFKCCAPARFNCRREAGARRRVPLQRAGINVLVVIARRLYGAWST
jgi:hypothetical protein